MLDVLPVTQSRVSKQWWEHKPLTSSLVTGCWSLSLLCQYQYSKSARWRRGVVVIIVRQSYPTLSWVSTGWVTAYRRVHHLGMDSTQLRVPLGDLATLSTSFSGVKVGMSPLPCDRQHCVIPYGMWVPIVVWQCSCELLYPFTLLYDICKMKPTGWSACFVPIWTFHSACSCTHQTARHAQCRSSRTDRSEKPTKQPWNLCWHPAEIHAHKKS